MNNYAWIRLGVKAVINNTSPHKELEGEIVTILSVPKMQYSSHYGEWIGVDLAEGPDLANKIPGGFSEVCPAPEDLSPYHEPGSWENDLAEIWKPVIDEVEV